MILESLGIKEITNLRYVLMSEERERGGGGRDHNRGAPILGTLSLTIILIILYSDYHYYRDTGRR